MKRPLLVLPPCSRKTGFYPRAMAAFIVPGITALVTAGMSLAWWPWESSYEPDHRGPSGVYLTFNADPAHGVMVHCRALVEVDAA